MLTSEEMMNNKNIFLDFVKEICQARDVDFESISSYLESTDFFEAPATHKYHNSYDGGLCEHCLKVLDYLSSLNELYLCGLDEISLKVVALFHDFSKVNFYEKTVFNKKEYFPAGKKHDNLGNFEWVSVEGWAVKDQSERFVFGSHEQSSAYMANSLIPLTADEFMAISHHHGGMFWDSAKDDISSVFDKSKLSLLLFTANTLASHINNE